MHDPPKISVDPDTPIVAYHDAILASWGPKSAFLVTTPNANYVPEVVQGIVTVCLRDDGTFGEHDPIQWPQMFAWQHPYLAAIPKRPTAMPDVLPASCPHANIWQQPTPDDFFVLDSRAPSYGSLRPQFLQALQPLIAKMSVDVRQYTLHPLCTVDLSILHRYEIELAMAWQRLCHTPATYRDQVLQLGVVRRYWLLCSGFMTFYDLLGRDRSQGQLDSRIDLMGAWTSEPRVAQMLFAIGVPVWLVRLPVMLPSEIRASLPAWLEDDETRADIEIFLLFLRLRFLTLVNMSRFLGNTNIVRRSPLDRYVGVLDYRLNLGIDLCHTKGHRNNVVARPGRWGYWIPEPGLLLGPKDPMRLQRYVMSWLRARPLWLSALQSRSACGSLDAAHRTQVWRDFLNGVEGDDAKSFTKHGKRTYEIKHIFSEVFSEQRLEPDAGGVAEWHGRRVSEVDDRIGPLVMWEAFELGFRYELSALDHALRFESPAQESERAARLARVFPEESMLRVLRLPAPDSRSLSAPLPHHRIPSLNALREILLLWPFCPPEIKRRAPLDTSASEQAIEELEVELAAFYTQTFFDVAGRAPLVPHCFPAHLMP
uniref:Dehydrogenase with different specificities n=1 Tax=Ganoderma boninense TaxID=34458 RepID=A0A5K1K5I2_9APHY|nr:Dehydrogenase with different specificities [Ganoderma boninense]